MTDNKNSVMEKEYEKLVLELKKELPNIVLPSMGMLDESLGINIDSKEFIVSDKAIKEV